MKVERGFRITNRAQDTAEVWIYDSIGMDWWMETGVSAKAFAQELHDISAPNILLHLNSPGGDVFEGVAIATAIREHPADVTVKVEGIAASAASFIAMSGNQVVMSQGSMMMIHEGQGITMGNAADHRKTSELLDKISNNIAGYYARKAGGTVMDWRARMEAETWYDAEEAVKAGLADEVSADQAAQNIFNLDRFRNAPERLRNEGRRNASPDAERIQRIHDLTVELEALCGETETENRALPNATDQEPTAATSQERKGWQVTPLVARLHADLVEAGV